ncbi:MAG: sigma factor [Rhodospirillales bacterium]
MALSLHLEIEQQRPYLLRIARLQLRNESVAEDVVQDTLIAALEGAARFQEIGCAHLAGRHPQAQDHRPDTPRLARSRACG